ncbi:MAG: hypothetical protein AAFU73_23450 [Planctomycetota bacterium]
MAKKKASRKRKPSTKRSPRKAPPRELVSKEAFGKLIGVSRQAVDRAIESGRLVRSVEKSKKGRLTYTRIDVAIGQEEWAQNTAPRNETGRATVESEPTAAEAEARSKATQNRLGVERARKEAALADRYELEVLERSRSLVNREAIRTELFKLGRVLREAHASAAIEMPDRLAAMGSAKEIQIALERHAASTAERLIRAIQDLIAELQEGDDPDAEEAA